MYERIGDYKTGFHYIDKQTQKKIDDEDILTWIKSLRIPPAYKDVVISKNKGGKILAYGFDSKMRKQVIYHPKFTELQQEKKYKKVMKLHKVFQKIMHKVLEDMQESDTKIKELAMIVYLIVNCGFRVGNKKYEKLNQSYGITTIKFKHITFKDQTVNFDFIGKKGVQNVSKCDNQIIYKYLLQKKKQSSSHDNVFSSLTSEDVNTYLKQFDTSITSKDLRTWNANMLFLQFVKEAIQNEEKNPMKAALKKVSEQLHNTSNVCIKNYIDPNIAEKIKNDYI